MRYERICKKSHNLFERTNMSFLKKLGVLLIYAHIYVYIHMY